jgi:cbb3-type cytochrome oxidase subunit 3
MAVVPLTLTISLCLVFTFVIFFLREHARGRFSSAERDSLLPLAEERPNPTPAVQQGQAAPQVGATRLTEGR